MVGVNCISGNNVIVDVQLDMVMAEFINVVGEFRNFIISQSNKAINVNSMINNLLFITNVTEGSVNVLSTLSVGKSSLVDAIANGISQALSSGIKIGSGIPISGKAVANVLPTSGSTTTNE